MVELSPVAPRKVAFSEDSNEAHVGPVLSSRHSLPVGRHASTESYKGRRCQSWSPGTDRVKVWLPLRPVFSLDNSCFNASRTFGGIERKVRPQLPTAKQTQDFASFTESFKQQAKRKLHVVAFVNSHSGGQTGELIMKTLVAALGPERGEDAGLQGEVCDLSQRGEPEKTITRLAKTLSQAPERETRLLVCGGDGTVTWILTALDNCRDLEDHIDRVPLAIVPLGTGNDLARSLGWGGKLKRVSDILEYLKLVMAAEPVTLDQWRVVLRPHTQLPDNHKLRTCGSHPQAVADPTLAEQLWKDLRQAMGRPVEEKIDEAGEKEESRELFLGFWQNYFSLGLDAKVTNYVDIQRSQTTCGKRCFGWGCGKACYAWQAVSHAFGCALLDKQIRPFLVAPPGESPDVLEELDLAEAGLGRFRQLMLVNINSYGAGQQVLPRAEDASCPPAPGDGVLEVLSMRGPLDGVAVFSGLGRPRYVASTEAVAFTVLGGQYMQLDGEPWHLGAGCDILVEPHRRVPMLLAPAWARHWRGHIRREFWEGDQGPWRWSKTLGERGKGARDHRESDRLVEES